MTRANVARRQGDDFQARLFWLKAAALLDPKSPTVRVAYEKGPKSFDDILVEYDPKCAPIDHEGHPILRRHIQAKWHTTAGTFGYQDLTVPAFINAERHSLLQRAQIARSRCIPDRNGCPLELVTNWRLLPDDALIHLVRKESDALDLDRLFDGTTDRSRIGRVRNLWRKHLNVDDAALRLVARALTIAETPESLATLRERLDERFAAVGMKRVPANQSAFLYDDLIVKLFGQGRVDFDKDGFRAMCNREGLIEEPGQRQHAPAIGVRSFMHPIDNLEDRCDRSLNLVPYFDGRYIRHDGNWQSKVLPKLRDFVLSEARSADHLRLILDVHVSLAFAVGTLLNVKSGKRIEIEQRTGGRQFWSMNDTTADSNWPKFIVTQEPVHEGQHEIAVAVSLTHDVSAAVRTFAKNKLGHVGRFLQFLPEGGASQQSVRCGRHAWMLAESVVGQMQLLRDSSSPFRHAHLFVAGPNGFAFFLGQLQQAIGPVALYEWDFESQRGGGYSQGGIPLAFLSIPDAHVGLRMPVAGTSSTDRAFDCAEVSR